MYKSDGARGDLLRFNEFRIGDTRLIGQYFALCSYFNAGRLFLTAPYYDEWFIELISKYVDMQATAFEVVVKNDSVADKILQSFRRHRAMEVEVYISKHIHAKVYIFESRTSDLAAMIGSHNPTRPGMSRNLEVGVVVSAKRNRPEWRMISDLRDYVKQESHFYGCLSGRRGGVAHG